LARNSFGKDRGSTCGRTLRRTGAAAAELGLACGLA
jgi:hypothetical protein